VKSCTVAGCTNPRHAKQMCKAHYLRVRRTGSTERITLESRFFGHLLGEDENGCWLWDKPNPDGYGQFQGMAHRWSFEFFIGSIPEGLQLDHLCRNRRCVNPWHLEPVSVQENLLRGETLAAENAAKTSCDHGHPFDSANTYITPDGRRQCRQCRAAAKKKYEQRRAHQLAAA
jgi:hypothetical protein